MADEVLAKNTDVAETLGAKDASFLTFPIQKNDLATKEAAPGSVLGGIGAYKNFEDFVAHWKCGSCMTERASIRDCKVRTATSK